MFRRFHVSAVVALLLLGLFCPRILSLIGISAQETSPPQITGIAPQMGTNAQTKVSWTPYPSAEQFRLLWAQSLTGPYAEDPAGAVVGYDWFGAVTNLLGFVRLAVIPLSSNALATATALNRLAYGPTPDDVERYLTGPDSPGPDAFIEEQLAPETISEPVDEEVSSGDFKYVTKTGPATTSTLYLYLTSPGDVYLDDIKLVAGSVAGAGPNLLQNGDFETDLSPAWVVSPNHARSEITTNFQHSGASSLHLIATSGGTTRTNAIWQDISPAVHTGQTYTVSFWYLPGSIESTLTVRLSGSGLANNINIPSSVIPATFAKLSSASASLDDLRAWYVLHAVRARRQLFEVLTQFVDNHFSTQQSKSVNWFNPYSTNATQRAELATDFEFRELLQWRRLLLDPNCTFYDLLRVSAESPAMIIYLDTVTNRKGTANENYSRELMELHTMGVDNGYSQTDISTMSKCWTGWTVHKVPADQAGDPFASPLTNVVTDPGVWVFGFNPALHDETAKTIFRTNSAPATVPARFGPPYAGRSYQLALPARTGTNGIQDGYDIIAHLANLPQTQEFISVKLCQWFVHEQFAFGYDFRQTPLSAEAQLVRNCMTAWETPAADGRKGNLRAVLRVIFGSPLFRSQEAARQKVKTPLEFVVSAIRALRTPAADGGFTADTDGYDLRSPMGRMGMNLFDRVDPDGWPEKGAGWIDTARISERMRFIQNLLMAATDPLKDVDFGGGNDDNVSDPVKLLQARLPSGQWKSDTAVADFFLPLLFPGEGAANLDLDRRAALAFLNTDDAGHASLFANLVPGTGPYDARVRGMAALLMTFPRFNEQ